MSREVLITCNGCGKEKREDSNPLLISDMDRQRECFKWAHVEKGEIRIHGIGVQEFDYCNECWIVGLTAILTQKVGA